MRRVRFIINPISGVSKKHNLPRLIEEELDKSEFEYDLVFTEAPGHACELAREAVALGYDIVAAAGGDGTINEIGSELVGSKTVLAVIPVGSGNGLARRLNIPTERRKAIRLIAAGKEVEIDAPTLNGQYFFSVAGVGFDALVSHQFALTKQRGFFEYARLIAQNYFQYEFNQYEIEVNGELIKDELFFLTIANSGQFGYEVKIAPDAELTDGRFELVLVKAHPKWKVAYLVSILMMGLVEHSEYATLIQSDHAIIRSRKPIFTQIDGDAVAEQEEIEVKMGSKKLKMIVPANLT